MNNKKLITILILCTFLLLFTGCNKSPSADNDYIGAIQLEIVFPDDYDADNITTEYSIKDTETALNTLIRYGKEKGLPVVLSEDGMYVAGIASLFEMDYGDSYGWLYWINDESPSVGASEYELKDGDSMVWKYIDFNEVW